MRKSGVFLKGIFKKEKDNTINEEEQSILVAFLEPSISEKRASVVKVKDLNHKTIYNFKQNFGAIPDSYVIYDSDKKEIGKITAKTGEILPGYEINIYDKEIFTVEKSIEPFDQSYMINNLPLVIDGDFFDLEYEIFSYDGEKIATIKRINDADLVEVYVSNKLYSLEVICSAFCSIIGKQLI